MKSKLHYLPISIIFVAALIFGSFFDQQISTALYVKGNPFLVFMSAFGEFPAYALLAFVGGFMGLTAIKQFKGKPLCVILIIFAVICIGCASYFQAHAIFNPNGFNKPKLELKLGFPITFVVFGGIFALGGLAAFKAKNPDLWKIALAIALGIGVICGIIQIVKIIPHRPRFRTVCVAEYGIPFKNWWERFGDYKSYITGDVTKEEFKSFPSGHTGIITCLLLLPYVPVLMEKDTKLSKTICFYAGTAFALLLGFTRIQAGAHYLSDVAVGGIISTALCFVCNEIIQKKLIKE